MCRVLQNADTLIGEVEENDCGTQYTAFAEYIKIYDVTDTYKDEYQDLTAYALKAYLTGEVLVGDGAHDTSDVVNHRKGNQRI